MELSNLIQNNLDRYDPLNGVFLSEIDAEIFEICSNRSLEIFHVTRLTDLEIEDLKKYGLRPSSIDLFRRKIELALSEGLFDKNFGDELLANSYIMNQTQQVRWNSLYVNFGDSELKKSMSNFYNLARIWGGECLNFTRFGNSNAEILKRIGQPSIVYGHIPLENLADKYYSGSLYSAFASAFSEYKHTQSFQLSEGIPATQIIKVLTSKDAEFQQYVGLRDCV